ncbi:FAD-binding oxidoreductase [Burkholderia cenocepacia]|nr:FAD-binding oxidoreductase [Burkholderia cenocepacia]MDS0803630.1 FAD-binding oxidoreductase [Burkholderia cenocepacia]
MIRFEPSKVELPCAEGATLLETALSHGYFPKHSCRRGECRVCETEILSGQVRYPGGLPPDDVTGGHCLTCMAVPTSDIVLQAPEVSSVAGRKIAQVGARVAAVERVSEDVAIVQLKLPPDCEFSFDAGQYVDVILRDGTRRSYSMANAPSSDGVVEWHVRAMPHGRFSGHVYKNLKVRDLLKIEGPFGAFNLRESVAPVILIASGTGYAPVASIMRAHGEVLARRGARFYWGGRKIEDLYAFDEVLAWRDSSPNFHFIPVLSNPDPMWTGRTGFVHLAIKEDFSNLADYEVYACGNPLMIDAARQTFLDECNLDEVNFISDSFATAIEKSAPVCVE